MFEKEAIRHAFEDTIGVECLIKPVEDFTYEELSDEQQEKAYDFKKGAEFGYNKAFVEADKNLKAIVTDFNKAKELEKEKCELLGIIQGKDKVIQELKKELNSMLVSKNQQLAKSKEIVKEMLSILPKENIEGIYEITEEAEHFLRKSE